MSEPDVSSSRWRRVVRVAVQGVLWAALLVAVAVVLAAIVVPRATGATPYTVLTGSMRPDHPPGTLVVVRPVDLEDVAVGDVITYQLESGEADVVTHRVVGIDVVDGETLLRTRGDANDVDDRRPVREEQLKGRLWYSLPLLGHVAEAADASTRRGTSRLIGLGLLAYAAWHLVGVLRRRRAGAPEERATSPPPGDGGPPPPQAV